jgi:hypothetical protein
MNKLRLLGIVALLSIVGITRAQLAGTYSVPATYSSIAAAVNALNTQGVSGTVTILISAAYTETAPAGGYSLTATGTATSPIIFMKNGGGANPLILAYGGGTSTPTSAFQDGVFRLIGSDYITIDGLDIVDQNTVNPATMEFGYGLFKASATDGCQYNLIRNCNISLSNANNASGILPAVEGSRGIDVVNSTSNAHTSALAISQASGSNSFNRFYSNTIRNCNVGISFIGYSDFNPFTNGDQGNDFGGTLAATGNTVMNFGGAASASYPATGVITQNQYSINISNNLIRNNNGSINDHVNTLRGIYMNSATSASVTANNNTITLTSGSGSSYYAAIYNLAGSTANNNTVSISNNLIANCTSTAATSITFYGIYNSASPYALSISNNTLQNNSTNASSGSWYNIYNGGATTYSANYTSNLINLATFSTTGTSMGCYGVYHGSAGFTSTVSISSNTFQNINHNVSGTGVLYMIYSPVSHTMMNMQNNVYNNITLNSTSTCYFAMCYAYNTNITGNQIAGSFNRPLLGGTNYFYYAGSGSTGTANISNNNWSNVNTAGCTTYGIYHITTSSQTLAISNNTISNINNGSTYTNYGMYVYYPYSITNNVISNISNGGTNYGLYIPSGINAYTVASNTIAALTSTSSSTMYGMYSAASSSVTISKNKIYDLSVTYPFGSGAVYGMYLSSGTQHTISNNYIGDLRTPYASGSFPVVGMYVSGGTAYNVWYNTIWLNASSSSGFFGSTALYASTSPQLELRNNILINMSTPAGGQYVTAYRRSSSTISTYSATSNNNIFYGGTPGVNNLIYYDGINAFQTLASYQGFVTPRDNVSKTENTPFLSVQGTNPSFLHINPAAPSFAESGAVNVGNITDDFDGDIRQGNPGYLGGGTAPDIGADEYNANVQNCNVLVGGTITPNPAYKCTNQAVTLYAGGYSAGNGITYQWQVSNNPGGPYANVVGGTAPDYAPAYTTPTLGNGTYYYVLTTSCSISNSSITSQEATVTIMPPPTLTVTPATSTICVPGGASVSLVASGAVTYTWMPNTGLNNNIGASVTALPGSTTIYTVTGTNLGGCSTSTTATVNIANYPTFNSVTASPTLVCGAGSSTLNASGSTPGTYTVFSITYSPIPVAAGATTLANGGVAVQPLNVGSLDDGAWYNVSIPFNFNFFGTTYTACAVSSNGFLSLGGGTPYTYNGYGNTFPSTFAGRPCIGSVYADLDWQYSGVISYYTVGSAPNRKFVVDFSGGKYYSNNGSVSFQIILYETNNWIESHITNASGANISSEVIQNAAGTIAYPVPGRNAAYFSVNTPDAYRWTPGPVTYSWTPPTFLNQTNIANPVASGVNTSINYTVSITSPAGCQTSSNVALVADNYPVMSVSGTNTVCSTFTINETASGANTYSWNTGATTAAMSDVPSTGIVTYSVWGTSALGCTTLATKNVTVYATPTINISGASTVCAGSFIQMNASGANTFSWSTGSTLSIIVPAPTVNTTYSVIGTTTAGCTNTVSKMVIAVPLPSATITAIPGTTMCMDGSANLVASGLGVDSYSWSTGQTTPFITVSPTVSTTYTVYVQSNSTGCVGDEQVTIVVKRCTGLDEKSAGADDLLVYPNPNTGVFNIELNNGMSKALEMYDVTGRIVYSNTIQEDKLSMDISSLAKGIYYLKVQSNNSYRIVKVVKQ